MGGWKGRRPRRRRPFRSNGRTNEVLRRAERRHDRVAGNCKTGLLFEKHAERNQLSQRHISPLSKAFEPLAAENQTRAELPCGFWGSGQPRVVSHKIIYIAPTFHGAV